MFALSRSDVPVVSIGSIDDSSFTPGDIAAWAAVFVGAYRTARGNGVPLRGIVRMAVDLATRVMGAAPVMDSSMQFLTQLSTSDDSLQLIADSSLASDVAVID